MKTIPTEINPTLITCINCSLSLVTTCEGVGGRVTTHAPPVVLFPQSLTGPIRVHTQNVSGVGECVTYTVYQHHCAGSNLWGTSGRLRHEGRRANETKTFNLGLLDRGD